jgi:hypothetical protein
VHLKPVLIVNLSVPREGVVVIKNHATLFLKLFLLVLTFYTWRYRRLERTSTLLSLYTPEQLKIKEDSRLRLKQDKLELKQQSIKD